MSAKLTLTVALIGLLVLSAVTPAFVGMAAAQEKDSNPLDDILAANDEEPDDSFIGKAKAAVPDYLTDSMAVIDGQLSRMYAGLSDKNPFKDDPKTNEEFATDFDRAVEDRGETFISLINENTNASTAYDTHQVTFAHEGSDTHVVYLVADIDNETVQSTEVLSESEFNETGRSVDAEWVVDERGAEELGELTRNLADRIEDDRPLDRTKQAQLVGRFCELSNPMSKEPPGASCDIRSSLWMDHESLYKDVEDDS